jgi:hypothetical protein
MKQGLFQRSLISPASQVAGAESGSLALKDTISIRLDLVERF